MALEKNNGPVDCSLEDDDAEDGPKKTSKKRNKDDNKWMEHLVEFLKSKCPEGVIPVMTKIKRGVARQRVKFDQYRSMVERAQRLFENNPDAFRSRSEVDRAAHYLGIPQLECIFTDNKNRKLQKLGEYLREVDQKAEPARLRVCVVATFVESVKDIHDSFLQGATSAEEMDEDIKDLIKRAPASLKRTLEDKVARIKNNENVTDIVDSYTWGGSRKKEER